MRRPDRPGLVRLGPNQRRRPDRPSLSGRRDLAFALVAPARGGPAPIGPPGLSGAFPRAPLFAQVASALEDGNLVKAFLCLAFPGLKSVVKWKCNIRVLNISHP